METSQIAIEAAASAAASTAAVIAGAEETVAAVIEGAEARVAQAERTAEQIAEAAMESERGREISTLREEVSNCREELRNQSSFCGQLGEQVTQLSGQLQALLTLEIIAAAMASPQPLPAPTVSSVSTPSNLAEAAETAAAELNPANLSAVVEAASPAPVTPRRGKIRL